MLLSKKKKILLLFYEPFKSGISRHIRYIVDILPRENYELWLLCSSNDQKIISFFREVMPQDRIVSIPPNRFFSLKGLVTTGNIVRKYGIDIVHIHNLQSILWGYGGAIIGGCNNIIFTPHIDTDCAGRSQWFFKKMWRLFDGYTSALIALTSSQKEWFLNWKISNDRKIFVINNHISEYRLNTPISTNIQSNSINKLSTAAKERFIVTQIGRLDRQKDPFFLLRVAEMIQDKYPKILFVLVGEGPLGKKIEKAVNNSNIRDNVMLVGHQSDINTIFKISNIVSLTSRWEGMPYVLLEALCFKKAVIATNIPGNKDLIVDGKNGFLIHNEEDFCQRLITLFHSPDLRHHMGETGYAMNRHLFDVNNMKKALCSLYNMQ